MSLRVDERKPKQIYLEAYDKALKLTDHVMSVCKPKDKNINTKHIPKRNAGLGRQLMEAAIELGADILEANNIYVGSNQDTEVRIRNYEDRIRLEENAKRLTYRMEHIFRVLHFDRPFAESTSHYMMDLLCETRDLLIGWKESEIRAVKALRK